MIDHDDFHVAFVKKIIFLILSLIWIGLFKCWSYINSI